MRILGNSPLYGPLELAARYLSGCKKEGCRRVTIPITPDEPVALDGGMNYQPEENLDNQTVYSLLVPVIKEAKDRRQVIMVTHNANLAVTCDAEQIIHAVFDRNDANKMSYVSGAVESPEINGIVLDILEGTEPAFMNRKSKYMVRS